MRVGLGDVLCLTRNIASCSGDIQLALNTPEQHEGMTDLSLHRCAVAAISIRFRHTAWLLWTKSFLSTVDHYQAGHSWTFIDLFQFISSSLSIQAIFSLESLLVLGLRLQSRSVW